MSEWTPMEHEPPDDEKEAAAAAAGVPSICPAIDDGAEAESGRSSDEQDHSQAAPRK